MSNNKGLFLPISAVQGDTLDVAFDLSIDGETQDPSDYSFEGVFWKLNDESTNPIMFTIAEDDTDPYLMHFRYTDTDQLNTGEYRFQIRATDNESNSKDTIIYGSLVIQPSFMLTGLLYEDIN